MGSGNRLPHGHFDSFESEVRYSVNGLPVLRDM